MCFLLDDVAHINTTEGQINQILFRMTPVEIRQQSDFHQAFQIRNELFSSFDDLYEHREKIQYLILLPIKDQTLRQDYAKLDKQALADDLIQKMKDSPMMLCKNDYPYEAPSDVQQYLLWIKNKQELDIHIANFIARAMQLLNVKAHESIMFERPANTGTKLVRGTFPLIRHLHLWTKIK